MRGWRLHRQIARSVAPNRRKFRFGAWSWLVVLALMLGACGSAAERVAVCDRSVGLEHEFAAVSRTLDDLAIASSQQLVSTFAVTLATLTTLLDLGPSSLRSDFALLLDVYETVATAVEATDWNGEVAVNDPVVTRARTQLVSNDAEEARGAVRSYVARNCSVEFGGAVEQYQGTPTTLPNPVVASDNAPDPTTGFDNEDSIASSFGYYVAEQYNLAITNEQAICVGRVLTEQALLDPQKTDDAYEQLISTTLISCGVIAEISGS